MKIICSNCKKEIENKEVYMSPRILSEESLPTGITHYVAVADVRTMCEHCGRFVDILGIATEISPSDIIELINHKVEQVDEEGNIKGGIKLGVE